MTLVKLRRYPMRKEGIPPMFLTLIIAFVAVFFYCLGTQKKVESLKPFGFTDGYAEGYQSRIDFEHDIGAGLLWPCRIRIALTVTKRAGVGIRTFHGPQ